MYLFQVLPGERCHSPPVGRGPVARLRCSLSMSRVSVVGVGVPRDLVGTSHPVLEAPPLAVSKDEIER